jgi:hypothetical protein
MEYPDGTPIFGPCSRISLVAFRFLAILAFAVHVVSYMGSHATGKFLPELMKILANREMMQTKNDDIV